MTISSHRLKIQEKKLIRKLIGTFFILILFSVLSIYIGLPLLAKIAIGLSFLRKEKAIETSQENTIVMPPVIEPIPESTNSAKISISGFADKDNEIKFYNNGKFVTKVSVDDDGKFSQSISLEDGKNEIEAVTEKKEITSQKVSLVITYKKNPPLLEITSHQNGDTVRSEDGKTTIKGTTDPENRVSVNDRFAIVDAKGNFSIMVSLSDGNNKFRIQAWDDAGNKEEKELEIRYLP